MKLKIFLLLFFIGGCFATNMQAQTKDLKIFGEDYVKFYDLNEDDACQIFYFYDSTNSVIDKNNIQVFIEPDRTYRSDDYWLEAQKENGYTKYKLYVYWHPGWYLDWDPNIYAQSFCPYYKDVFGVGNTFSIQIQFNDSQGATHLGYKQMNPPKADQFIGWYPITPQTQVYTNTPVQIGNFLNYIYSAYQCNYTWYLRYYWLQSTDGKNWSLTKDAIDGGNGWDHINVAPTAPVTYYKRIASFGICDYYDGDPETQTESNIITVYKCPPLKTDAFFTKTNSTTCNDPLDNGNINCTVSGGCNNAYTYQWQRSFDKSNWQDLAGATNANYNCSGTIANGNTYYRCKVKCVSDETYSNTLTAIASIQNTTGNLSYVRTYTPQTPFTNKSYISTYYIDNPSSVLTQTQYIDAFSRPFQEVTQQTSPDQRDMVNIHVYDAQGRESQNYLPYASSIADGAFKVNPMYEQKDFYQNVLTPQEASLQGEQTFYGKTEYEASPLGRPTKVMAPGNSWAGSGKGVQMQYLFNNANDHVWKWSITNNPVDDAGNIPTSNGEYAAGQLYKTVTLDEQNNATVEYKDKEGRVILKKVQSGDIASDYSGYTGFLCTYYMYDYLGQLRFVIQPKGVEQLTTNNRQLTTTLVAEQCFRYEYDSKLRLIAKKVPGAGWVYMVYDNRDRLVFTQDAVMRPKQQWMATFYDELNRPVETALLTGTYTRDALQSYVSSLSNTSAAYAQGNGTLAAGGSFAIAPQISMYPVPAQATIVPLTLTYYDDYANTSLRYNTTNNSKVDWGNGIGAESLPATASTLTKGAVTVTKTRILQDAANPATGAWLETAIFYDDKGRPVQTQTTNCKGGTDITTTRYSFTGKAICSYTSHNNSSAGIADLRTKTTMQYDHAGRLLQVTKTINDNAGTQHTISKTDYDALGQLKKKTLDATPNSPLLWRGAGGEAFDYNIRGWLTGMNKDFVKNTTSAGGAFGYEIGYDNPATLIPNTSYLIPQYNGNISGITWRSTGDGEQRKYDFNYDKLNRLTAADFNQYTGGSFNKNAKVDFSVSNLTYDANGNILTMNQTGLKPTGSTPIDQLSYRYADNSNRLMAVTDAIAANNNLGDFTDRNSTGDDYAYDANGNLTMDKNKNISKIEYNYLNLPYKVTTDKGTIEYMYDATGNKLEKTINETGKPANTTTYIGNYVYQNNVLQFFGHEEGRVRQTSLPSGGPGWAFDYFIKDHLGNVRMVLTDEQKTDVYPAATLEGNINGTGAPDAIAVEKNYYDINAANVVNKSEATGITDYVNNNGINNPNPYSVTTANSAKLYKLQATQNGGVTGLGFTAKVMSGDKVNILGKSYYFNNNTTKANYNIPFESILTGLLGGSGMAGKATVAELSGNTAIKQAIVNGLQDVTRNNNGTDQTPKAYINYILFDEQFNAVKTGFSRVSSNNAVKDHYSELQNIPVEKNGYLYVYCSNESPVPVYFDNLQVTHQRGPILEETHYSPFGLTMQGISSQANSFGGAVNHYKYNGKEEQCKEFSDGSSLDLYDYNARFMDRQTGRFTTIDPHAANYYYSSPYSYVLNNPISNTDPTGMDTHLSGDAARDFASKLFNNGYVQDNWTIDTWDQAAVIEMNRYGGESFYNFTIKGVLPIYESVMPAIYRHTVTAQGVGYPALLTYAGDGGVDARRRQALKQFTGEYDSKYYQVDEYPYACTLEGGFYAGRLASVQLVPADENRVQGWQLSSFTAFLGAGDQFMVMPIPTSLNPDPYGVPYYKYDDDGVQYKPHDRVITPRGIMTPQQWQAYPNKQPVIDGTSALGMILCAALEALIYAF